MLIMKSVAIIPARGGSKRIPKKNIRLFAGAPMISYSIRAAQESGLFDAIIVSTDDDDVARIACDSGAEVPFRRPPELADDYTGTDDVILGSIDWLEEHRQVPEYVCCIYATAPFLLPEDLRRGWDLIRSKDCAAAFSVTTYAYTIFRSLRIREDGCLEMFWPENQYKRSQDLPEAWHDAGQFYWGVTDRYRRNKLFFKDAMPVILPRWRVQDIDTIEDWEHAEKLFQILHYEKDCKFNNKPNVP